MASYTNAGHGRLHRRGNSASSQPPGTVMFSPVPSTEPSSRRQWLGEESKMGYDEDVAEEPSGAHLSSSFKIKPYLRKKSLREDTRIDLSRPFAENEGLAGLGIHDFGASSRSASEVNFVPISSSRARHNRSTSVNSQFSTNSAIRSPTMPYAHPMRHTPRPYTPPIAKSYTTSVIGSEISDEAGDNISEEEPRYRQRPFDAGLRSDAVMPLPAAPHPLHIHTSGSLTRLNNPSLNSVHSSVPAGRSRGATLQSVDTCISPTPTSRTSIDKAIGFIRGSRTDEPVDPASRAASIRAARIAYNEREEAKERKAEKEELRRQDRESKRRGKKEERQRRRSDAEEKRRRVRVDSSNEKLEAFVGKSYNDTSEAHARSLPTQVAAPPTPSGRTNSGRSAQQPKQGPRNRWLAFMAWFRTRLLRFGRMMHLKS